MRKQQRKVTNHQQEISKQRDAAVKRQINRKNDKP